MSKSCSGFSRYGLAAIQCLSGTSLILALAGCGDSEPKAPPAQEVQVVTVEKKTVDLVIPRLGQLESSREVDVVARVSGFLEKKVYDEGALLQEGDVMFVMDKRPFEAQVSAAKGELEASKARLWTANANLKRVEPLTKADAMSQSDLDQAIGEQRSAQAAVYSAQAQLETAELNLGYTTIYSPVTGLSGEALQREGAYLNTLGESAKLSYVAQLDPIWVNFSISQNELEKTSQDKEKGLFLAPKDDQYVFEIVLPNGRVFAHKGSLDFLSPTFSPQTGTFMVRASVANPDFELRPGMFVNANLLGAKHPNAIVVPQQAVIQSGNQQVVMVVNDKNVVEQNPVEVGQWLGDEWIIDSGLQGGESIIVEGYQKVRPGMTVKALHYIPKTNKPAPKTNPPAKKENNNASRLNDKAMAKRLAAN